LKRASIKAPFVVSERASPEWIDTVYGADAVTLRIILLPVSAMSITPVDKTTRPVGLVNMALVPSPSAKPHDPPTINVEAEL
jgi:hypothetical protein